MGKCGNCDKTDEDWKNRGEPALVSELGLGSFLMKQQSAWYDKNLCWRCGGDLISHSRHCKNCECTCTRSNWEKVETELVRKYKLDYVFDSYGNMTYQDIDKSKYKFRMAVRHSFKSGKDTVVSGTIECGTISVNEQVDIFFKGQMIISMRVIEINLPLGSNSADSISELLSSSRSVNTASEGQDVSITLKDQLLRHTMEDGWVIQIAAQPHEQEILKKQLEEKKAAKKVKEKTNRYNKAVKDLDYIKTFSPKTPVEYNNISYDLKYILKEFQELQGYENANGYASECDVLEREYTRLAKAVTTSNTVRIGIAVQIAISLGYLYLLFLTDVSLVLRNVSGIGFGGWVTAMIPIAVFSVAIGIASLLFLRRSCTRSGMYSIIYVLLIHSGAMAWWNGAVGFLAISLILRFILYLIICWFAVLIGYLISISAEAPSYSLRSRST